MVVIIALAVAIYATREIPDHFEDDKEWEFWRNLDFAVCVISLAFASVLLYGSITEFRMFLSAWMIWNVILIIFWHVFLVRKYNELVEWERTYRIVAIVLMAFAEIPVFSYFRYLRVQHKDPESNFAWLDTQSDKVYKTLDDRPSFSSIDLAMFGGNTRGAKNPGFQSDSPRSSVISVASEEIESREKEEQKVEKGDKKDIAEKDNENEKVEKEDKKERAEKENEVEKDVKGNEEKQDDSDVQSQSSFAISVTVHTNSKPAETDNAIELHEVNESSTDIENSTNSEFENVETTSSEVHLPTIEVTEPAQEETSSSDTELEEDKTTKIAATESDENQIQNQITSSIDMTEDTKANEMDSSLKDSSVVVEIGKGDITRSAHLETSVAVEIDVTDMAYDDVNQVKHHSK